MFLFFANYSRWKPVHLRDITSLLAKLRNDFSKFWTVCQRQTRGFTLAIPIDQVHKQENSKVRGKGGVVGLTDNPLYFCGGQL